MTVTIDRIKAIALLNTVVKGKEDFRYVPPPGGLCVYVDVATNTPSCLVGVALHTAGVPIEYLSDLDSLDGMATGEEDADGFPETYGGTGIGDLAGKPALNNETIILTDGAISVFNRAQLEQDRGTVWGKAVETAIVNGKGE